MNKRFSLQGLIVPISTSLKCCILFSTYLGLSTILSGQTINRPAPRELFTYEFEAIDSSFSGQYFTVPFLLRSSINDSNFVSPTPMIIDKDGYISLYLPTENSNNSMFRYWPNHKKYSLLSINTSGNYYLVFDSLLNPIDTVINSIGIDRDWHEFNMLLNGNYIIAGTKYDTVDLSLDTILGNPGNPNTPLVGFVVEEFDSNGNLLVQWNSNDHIDPLEFVDTYKYNPNKFDYCHGNAIELTADNNYLISFRNLDAIYKIDRSTGSVIWKLGGKSSSFTFSNDYGFSGQHDIRELPNGDISLFDNGNNGPTPKKSRAVIYSLDTNSLTAALLWSFNNSPNLYSIAMGNHHITSSKYHLVNYGMSFRPDPSITLTDHNKNKIAQFYFQDSVTAYRSFIVENPLSFPRPVVTCTIEGSSTKLSVQGNYNSYVWSTGDTTSSILVSIPGEYQVWTNHGMAMTGSVPINIINPSNGCNPINIEEINKNTSRKITAIYDLTGREVKHQKANTVYIILYSDGSYERVLTLE